MLSITDFLCDVHLIGDTISESFRENAGPRIQSHFETTQRIDFSYLPWSTLVLPGRRWETIDNIAETLDSLDFRCYAWIIILPHRSL